jgi:hypothetical protein
MAKIVLGKIKAAQQGIFTLREGVLLCAMVLMTPFR